MGINTLDKKLAEVFSENAREIVVLTVLFFAGLAAGTVVSLRMSGAQHDAVSEYMDCFFSAYTLRGADRGNVCMASVANNIRCLLIMCIPLLSAWLTPFLAAQIALKGFKIGFSVAFLTGMYGFFGAAVGFFSLFWQILFTLPALVLCGAKIMNFSFRLGGGIIGFSRFKNIGNKVYINLIFALITAVFVILAGGIFDGYAAAAMTLSLCGISEV